MAPVPIISHSDSETSLNSSCSEGPSNAIDNAVTSNDLQYTWGVIGKGTFGTVIKAKYCGQIVAVKRIHTEEERAALESEINILRKIEHENIVQLKGYAADHSILVMEYAEGGNLYNVLHHTTVEYSIFHALSWCHQTANGVSYLHGLKLVHRDIKPPNLLLQNYCRKIKICDFGTACLARTHMTSNQGSVMWMAPEVFSSQQYTEKCDVFSWAITFWEVLARQKPVNDRDISPFAVMWSVVSYQARPNLLNSCPQFIEDLIVKCWSHEPSDRPSMHQVARLMDKIIQIFNPSELQPIYLPEGKIDRKDEKMDYNDDLALPCNFGSLDLYGHTQTEPPRNRFDMIYPPVIPFHLGTEPTRSSRENLLVTPAPRRRSRDDRMPSNESHRHLHGHPVSCSSSSSSSSAFIPQRSSHSSHLQAASSSHCRPVARRAECSSGNILASGYHVDQNLKPLQPDRRERKSLQLYERHSQNLSEYVILELELKLLKNRKEQLLRMKSNEDNANIPVFEIERDETHKDISSLEILNENLKKQVAHLRSKQQQTVKSQKDDWTVL